MEQKLQNKKVAVIIAFKDFRDEEYFITKEILEVAGAKVITFSSSLGRAMGSEGGETEVNDLLENLKIEEFDAVLFIGGQGAFDYLENELCHRIARETLEKNKILGAICIAPAILANAGVLEGKKATVWNSPMDKSAVKILESKGALFSSDPVVVDGRIITAMGPSVAKSFGEKTVELLSPAAE